MTASPTSDPQVTDRTTLDARPATGPTRSDLRSAIPAECFEISTARSLAYLAGSIVAVAVPTALSAVFVPMTWAWLPVWLVNALVVGTAGTGLWVIAHECGHGAFSTNRTLQDGVGFVLHSLLLVPYFSWQRSHSVHHSKTNHLDEGETHVPQRADSPGGSSALELRERIGTRAYGTLSIATSLLVGWPAYLLVGATGSPVRGTTNHFWPVGRFTSDLFPKRWHPRVWGSAAGVLVVVALLAGWAIAVGSVVPVLLLFVLPYLGVNAWLIAYTWLQHTDVDVPHFSEPEWTWAMGALQTVDRPYGRVVDLLHHRIGSTHVAHLIEHRIPHYRARAATDAIAAAFPQWYRFDPTPVPSALWRVATNCVAVNEGPEGHWYFGGATAPSGSDSLR